MFRLSSLTAAERIFYGGLFVFLAVTLVIFLATPPKPPHKPTPSRGDTTPQAKSLPRVAIVIDDIGYNQSAAQKLFAIDVPLTAAVIPYATYATPLANAAHAAGKQIIIHMPMQPIDSTKAPVDVITEDMSVEQMRSMLADAKKRIPFAVGINNHMGSRFSANQAGAEKLMTALLPFQWFFLDSRTTADSRLELAAQQAKIPTLRRTLFLDNERSTPAINKQLDLLVEKATQDGQAIAIGHPYDETIAALESFVATHSKRTLQFVELSKLLFN